MKHKDELIHRIENLQKLTKYFIFYGAWYRPSRKFSRFVQLDGRLLKQKYFSWIQEQLVSICLLLKFSNVVDPRSFEKMRIELLQWTTDVCSLLHGIIQKQIHLNFVNIYGFRWNFWTIAILDFLRGSIKYTDYHIDNPTLRKTLLEAILLIPLNQSFQFLVYYTHLIRGLSTPYTAWGFWNYW